MENNNNLPYMSEIINSNSDLMKIQTNKEYYFKGETVEANIILDCPSKITLCDISISLYLKERWIIQETSTVKYGENNKQLLSKFDIGLSNILKNNNEIKELSPGRYIFPFKIELPNYLQPSFEYPFPNRYAYLRYSLESEIISGSIKSKSQIYLLIKSYPKRLNTPKIFSSVTNVHKWGMFDGGSTILKVSYNKNNYRIDELVPLNIEIDNNRGKLKVKECKIRIIRTIQFSRLDKESLEKYPLEKTIFTKTFWAEVQPNSKRSFLFQTELKDEDLIDFNYLGENNPFPNIKDLNILLPSMESRIIKCDYRIQVSLYFDSFVTSGYRPRVGLPIWITHQSQEESNIQNNSYINNEIINYNNNNYCCTDSSLLYDKNNFRNNNDFKNNIINNNFNNNIQNINEENKKNNYIYENNNLNQFSYIENEKNNNEKISNQNNNKKPNYFELKEEKYYNINEI